MHEPMHTYYPFCFIFSLFLSHTRKTVINTEEIQLVILIRLTVNKYKMINFNINGLKY